MNVTVHGTAKPTDAPPPRRFGRSSTLPDIVAKMAPGQWYVVAHADEAKPMNSMAVSLRKLGVKTAVRTEDGTSKLYAMRPGEDAR